MTLSTYFMEATYLTASILFIFALKGMSHPETARRGMFLAEAGMFAAIVGTLIGTHIITWVWIIAGLSLGEHGVPAWEVDGLQLLGQRRYGAGFDSLEDSGPRQDLVHVAPLKLLGDMTCASQPLTG